MFSFFQFILVAAAVTMVVALACRHAENFYMRRAISRAIVKRLPLFVAAIIIVGLSACGGGNSKTVAPPPPTVTPSPVAIELTPSTATVVPLAKQQFVPTITMSDGSKTTKGATFSATGAGSVDSTGVFTASPMPGSASVTANTGSLFVDASVSVVAPTSNTPNFTQAVVCGKIGTATCNITLTQGDAVLFFLHSDTMSALGLLNGQVYLTDSLNNQLVTTFVGQANPNSNTGLAEWGAAFNVAGGADVLIPPGDSILVVVEYQRATSQEPGGLDAGQAGNPSQTFYNNIEISQGSNGLAVQFILSETSTALNAGVGSNEHYQFENGNISILVQDLVAPVPGNYLIQFVPATPASFNSDLTMIAQTVLLP